jgi:hypothetical protein
MDAVEFELYRYMFSELPCAPYAMDLISTLKGTRHIRGRGYSYDIEATRMSGEMNTSLGNGFSNLMFMLYACERVGATNVSGIVEGDDGLFVMDGPLPTAQTFLDMGLTIKLDVCESISTASFCGLVFDEEDLITIADPIKNLLKFGWTNRQYLNARDGKLNALLRSKSLSILYQYRNAPIFQALARYGIRMTEGKRALSASSCNTYEKFQLENAYQYYNKHAEIAHKTVPIRTRLLMEREFGISVETQLRIESYLDSLTTICPLRLPYIVFRANEDCLKMYDLFVKIYPRGALDKDKFLRT